MIPPEIENKMLRIHELCKSHDVKEMYLFGSASRGEMTRESDYDFLVDIAVRDDNFYSYANNFFSLYDELEKLLSRKIDFVTMPMLRNRYLIQSINESKEKIYEAP
jgi:predicted nucleotidyltransferase